MIRKRKNTGKYFWVKLFFAGFLACITGCANIYHHPHRHLELVPAKESKPEVREFNSYRSNFKESRAHAVAFDSVENRSQNSSSKNILFNRDFTASNNFTQNKNEDQILSQQKAVSLPSDTAKEKTAEKEQYNKTAIWAGIFSLAGVLTSWFIFLSPILGAVGLILGIIALGKLKKNPSQRGREFAIAAIIVGIADILVPVVFIALLLWSVSH